MAATTQYSGGYYYGQNNAYNVQLTVPISIGCPTTGGQLWALGYAYDTATGTNLGSNNIIMTFNNGIYSGNLVFNLPSSVVGHQLQIQIQVFNSYVNGQYGGLVATSSPTVTVNPSGNYPSTGTYSYYNGYPTGCYNGYYYYSYSGYPYYYNYGYPYSCSYSYSSSYPYYYYYYSYPYYYHYGYYGGYHYHHR
jgi:hypothetical protein